MKKYKLHIKDVTQAGINFGLEGIEELISGILREIVQKNRELIEDSVLDAVHIESCFSVPYSEMSICEFDENSFRTYSIEEARELCEKVKVRVEKVNEEWNKVFNAETGQLLVEKINFANFQGILFAGNFISEGVCEVFLKSILKYANKERKFADVFE